MASQPWFKFFAGDWFSDGKLRMCRAEGIAVWIQALTYMHKEGTYSISGEIIELSMALNLPESQTDEGIRQLEKYDVCEVARDSHGCVTLTSRRLKREEDERAAARERKRLQRQREREQNNDVTEESDVHTRGHALTSDSDSLSNSSSEEDSSKNGSPRAREEPDYDSVMDSWNAFAEEVGLPTIRAMTRKRRAAVRAKHDEVWPQIDAIYRQIRGSPFLLGTGGRDSWRGATFDFVWLREDNYTRILEGAYGKGNGKRTTNGESRKEAFQRFLRVTGSTGSEER